MPVFDFFKEHPAGSAVDAGAGNDKPAADAGAVDQNITDQVTPIVEELRPYLQADGGDIELVKVEDQVVYVRLQGACVGCPSSLMTLRAGVEARIREAIPEVEAVEMV